MTYPYCIWLEAHKSKCRQINKKTYCSYYEYHVLPRAPRKNQYFSLDLTAQERSTSSSWPCLAIMTDTYKLLDLGRQILVSLISRVSSLDLKINNVSVYLISLLLFCSLSGTLSTNIKPERGILRHFPACLFSPRWTQRMVVKRELLYFDTKSLFIPRTLITLTGILHWKNCYLYLVHSLRRRDSSFQTLWSL